MSLTLQIGALCNPISEQLKGIVSSTMAKSLDADNDAITHCHVMGYMSDSATEKARRKLVQRCQTAVLAAQKGKP